MPSPPSTRPSGARGRRSFVFVREDGETATDSALLVGHHHRLERRDQFATMVAFAIWLISLTLTRRQLQLLVLPRHCDIRFLKESGKIPVDRRRSSCWLATRQGNY